MPCFHQQQHQLVSQEGPHEPNLVHADRDPFLGGGRLPSKLSWTQLKWKKYIYSTLRAVHSVVMRSQGWSLCRRACQTVLHCHGPAWWTSSQLRSTRVAEQLWQSGTGISFFFIYCCISSVTLYAYIHVTHTECWHCVREFVGHCGNHVSDPITLKPYYAKFFWL